MERNDFYRQDISFLRELGFEVAIATQWREIPQGCDLYFIWWWTWALLPLIKARMSRRPSVITGVFDYRWESGIKGDYFSRPPWQRIALRAALKGASANVFTSQLEYRAVMSGLPVNRPRYIPLTVDTERYRVGRDAREEVVFTLAWMGELNAKRKRLPEIVEAIPMVLARRPRVRFILGGDKGAFYPRLIERARQLGVQDSIDFPGVLSEPEKIDLMRRAKVYLQPTTYEGFGLAVAEAMSCGAGVVTSPAGAVPELVGDAALLVDGSDPRAIAEAVLAMLNNDPMREEFGRRAAARIRDLYPRERRRQGLKDLVTELFDSRPVVRTASA